MASFLAFRPPQLPNVKYSEVMTENWAMIEEEIAALIRCS